MESVNPAAEGDGTDSTMEGLKNCLTSDVNKDNSEEDVNISSSPQNVQHCLICNGLFPKEDDVSFNIFGKLKLEQGQSQVSVFEKVGQILARDLCNIDLHSELICHCCFNLLVEYETIEIKLQLLRSKFVCKFDETANVYRNSFTESCKTSIADKKCNGDNPNSANGKFKNVFIINEEGKLVDENGKERLKPFHVVNGSENDSTKVKKTMKDSASKNKKRYVCSLCGKGFRAFSHRVEHMLIHLGEKPWPCEDCKKTFRTKSALKVHSMKHSGERPFTCQQCGKSYVDKCYFEEHCRVHSGERPFMCLFCRRHFARKKDLVIHIKTHTGDKPYACSVCSKAFAVKSRLDRHARIHSGEKPHSCEYCGKSFARKDDYKVHIRQHTGERPFDCSFCNKTFTNQSNCLAHIRTHTGIKSYCCNICNQGFSRRLKMEKHIAEKHPTKESRSEEHLAQTVTEVVVPVEAEIQTASSQTVLQTDTIQSINVADLHTLQTLPVSQVAQVTWSDNLDPATATTTYVNLVPGTYVNIIN
ncbi:zinc finger protein OZF [Anabrus simplex]|uniref:zinc finger protein OZF n=1 Tax=Anabrus simplex TaxID=316456 RepID=UPI0035A389A9